MKTRIGILGYGNLGRGIESAIKQSEDLELVAVFTRRDPASVKIHTEKVPVVALSEALNWKDKIDVMVLCGGSATDLPTQTPEYAKHFNVINSFDTHAKIPSHFEAVDAAAKEGGKLALISLGWDPGLFSLNRMLATAILPQGKNYTFWGKGVSQGHSDGGLVIRSGVSGFHEEHKELIEFSLKLDSNPEFTGAVLAAYARAAHRLAAEGQTGCKTIFDVAPSYLSPLSAEELRAKLL